MAHRRPVRLPGRRPVQGVTAEDIAAAIPDGIAEDVAAALALRLQS